ncbi:MAG TPA: glycosyltransferase family 2 protein [Bacteroidales bacterium]|mgnify:CR=1 FL=1|nr:glycosyltransferase family 2 protein [Bacteroidales bacterium]HPS17663.1 glycosyltransferase family 2 protein [Bacteroidales bacterium]
MHNNILVSIITIIYNGEDHIQECVDSVRSQTYKNIEYIVVDGGSTDSSLDIIKKNLDIITAWKSEKDNGISDAFNKGIKQAKGDIIGILNCDDKYYPETIESVVNAYQENGFSEAVFYGDITYFNNKNEYSLIPEISKIWKYMSIFHPATFVSKSLYNKFGVYSLEYKYAMDSELIHRLLFNHCNFIYIPKTLTKFRLEGKSDINYINSYKEFFKSVKGYNGNEFGKLYMYYGLLKKRLLHSSLGTFINNNRRKLPFLYSGKLKK